MVVVIVALNQVSALAQTGSAPPAPTPALGEVFACAEIADQAQRLACYDGAVGRLRQAESQGRLVTVDREQVATLERESFGFSLPSISSLFRRGDSGPDQINRQEMEVDRVVRHGNGRYSFVMTNAQTWTQTELQPATNIRAGDHIAIERGPLGGYMLSPEHGRSHRVRREE
jgi:hypothetical protein